MTGATTVSGATVPAPNPCATCGACCTSYVVPVFGYDVWLLCTRQRLSPEQFCLIYPEKEPRVEAFQLESGGQRYSLALDKKGRFALKKPCIFLMELPGTPSDDEDGDGDGKTRGKAPPGNPRCGVYEDRPVVCRTYPMSLWSGVVSQRTGTLCPPDSWPLAAVSHPRWLAPLRRLCMSLDLYGEVVTRWNARVDAHPGVQFSLPEYFSYLLNVYSRLDLVSQALDGEHMQAAREHEEGDAGGTPVDDPQDTGTRLGGMQAVEATWPTFPRPPLDTPQALAAAGTTEHGDPLPWLRYFIRARQVIDSFYPHVPPQPPSLRSTPAPSGASDSVSDAGSGVSSTPETDAAAPASTVMAPVGVPGA